MSGLTLPHDARRPRSTLRLLVVYFILAAMALSESAGPSRLQFTTPERWTRQEDPQTHQVSVTSPGGNAALTFCESKVFPGTPEQWLHEAWTGVLEKMKLTGPSVAGKEGDFLTRTGEFIKPDGSKPWLCLFTLVKDGRGESATYLAANKAVFFSQLPTISQMMRLANPGLDEANRREASGVAGPPASASVPVLAYNEPAGFYRGASASPIEYSSNEVNAGIRIYPFRPFTGDIVTAFQRTLLRDWIAPPFRENMLAGPPQITPSRVRGATMALSARFRENIGGAPNERLRMLVIAGNQAALVDVSANSAYSWQKAGAAVTGLLDSVRVEQAAPPPSVATGPANGGSGVAGLYMGFKYKYNALYGTSQRALHYYVFSPDGRAHCCHDFPPGGNDTAWKTFNFDAAQRADPVNTGRYTVRGNQLMIQMGGESFSGVIRDTKTLQIQSVTYERQP